MSCGHDEISAAHVTVLSPLQHSEGSAVKSREKKPLLLMEDGSRLSCCTVLWNSFQKHIFRSTFYSWLWTARRQSCCFYATLTPGTYIVNVLYTLGVFFFLLVFRSALGWVVHFLFWLFQLLNKCEVWMDFSYTIFLRTDYFKVADWTAL